MKEKTRLTGAILFLALMLTACGGKQTDTQPVNGGETEVEEATAPGNAQEETGVQQIEEEGTSDGEISEEAELAHAMQYGFVPEGFDGDWEKTINEKEMAELAYRAISLCNEDAAAEWEKSMQNASKDREVEKDYGALFVFRAAQKMGSGTFGEHDYYYAIDRFETIWDVYEATCDYPMFEDCWQEMLEEPGSDREDVEVWPTDYLSFSQMFTIGKFSLYSNRPLFTGENIVCRDLLTRKEAVLAFSRLLDDTINAYLPIGDDALMTNSISEQAKEAGKTLPSVKEDTLPAWRGTSASRETLIYTDARELFTMEDVQLIQDQGFNYVRLICPHEDFVKEIEGEQYVNTRIMDNMDAMIGWCMENGIHVCLDMHSLPGFKSGGDADIMDNEEHYRQAVEIWEMLSKRYADVPENGLSYNLLNEPNLFYFTQESYGQLANDLIAAIRENDTEKLIVSDGVISDIWFTGAATIPCTELPADIVQTLHIYPSWDALNWLTVQNGLPEHYDAIAGVLQEENSLCLRGDFTAGSRIDLYYSNIYGVNTGAGLYWETGGADDGEWIWDGVEEGEDHCYWIDEGCSAYFDAETKLTIRITEDTDHVKLYVADNPVGAFFTLNAIEIRFSTEEENTYLIPDFENNSNMKYETDHYDAVFLNLAEDTWNDGAMNVTVERDGTYTCDNCADADMFDRETVRDYIQLWVDWRNETGGRMLCNEFATKVGLPEQARISYMEFLLEELKENDIPWAIYTTNEGDYGPIHKRYGEWHTTWPEDDSLTVEGENYAVDEPLLKLLQSYF